MATLAALHPAAPSWWTLAHSVRGHVPLMLRRASLPPLARLATHLPLLCWVEDRPDSLTPPTGPAGAVTPGDPYPFGVSGKVRRWRIRPGGPGWLLSVSRKGGGFFTTGEEGPADRPTAGQTCGLHHLRCLSRVSSHRLPAHASGTPAELSERLAQEMSQPPVPDGAGPVAIPRVPDPVVPGHACPAACRMRKRRSEPGDLWEGVATLNLGH